MNIIRSALVFALASLLTGCGLAIQTGMGWTETETREERAVQRIVVTSVPLGAEVCREEADGSCAPLGMTPLEDEVLLRAEEVVEKPARLGLWIGVGADIAAVVAATLVSVSRCNDERDCPATPVIIAAGASFATIVDVVTALFHPSYSPETVTSKRILDDANTIARYRGAKEGYAEQTLSVAVASETSALLRLDPIVKSDASKTSLVEPGGTAEEETTTP
jgi:hypothetical protein